MNPHTMAVAIAHEEGFYVAGSIPQKANNPGDLELGDMGQGKLGEGVTVFATVTDGWIHLDRTVAGWFSGMSRNYPLTMTLAELGMKYSGGDPNWAKNVASMLGVDESVTIAELAAKPDGVSA